MTTRSGETGDTCAVGEFGSGVRFKPGVEKDSVEENRGILYRQLLIVIGFSGLERYRIERMQRFWTERVRRGSSLRDPGTEARNQESERVKGYSLDTVRSTAEERRYCCSNLVGVPLGSRTASAGIIKGYNNNER